MSPVRVIHHAVLHNAQYHEPNRHIDDAAFKRSITFIEYHVDKLKERAEYENMEEMMRRLGAGRSPLADDSSSYCTYEIGEPPYFALNIYLFYLFLQFNGIKGNIY